MTKKILLKRVMFMTKIDVFSGFLGAGKTTLIKKLIKETYSGEKLVLIENEFGEIGIDGGFMKDAGIEVTEMNSGCICCSLVGDFTQSLAQVLEQFQPDRILIEPSGVGKLSDVIKAVQKVESETVKLNSFTTVADAGNCRIYATNFGEFYNDQIENAGCIILSRTSDISQEKLDAALTLLREKNADATIVTTPWDQLPGDAILAAMEQRSTLAEDIRHLEEESCPVCGHHHHEDEHHHDGECCCHDHHVDEHHEEHHHHHDGEECHCHEHHHDHHEHHHHHDGEECHCHEHHHEHHEEHHNHHGEECHCHEHGHHHHHHHADDVFDSWGVETTSSYSTDAILEILNSFADESKFGIVLRAKGIVPGVDGQWIHFDYVPGAPDVRVGCADVIGRLCVIGSGISKEALANAFDIKTEAK